MPTRRAFLKQNSLLAAGVRAAWAAPFVVTSARSAPAAPIAETANGRLRGRTEDGIHVFRGVPYGADTSGKNRFVPPRKPAPWQGTLDALEWGHVEPQPLPSGNYDYTRAVQWATQPGGRGENCLVLNVWTPGLKDGGKRAVLFSIHGGGSPPEPATIRCSTVEYVHGHSEAPLPCDYSHHVGSFCVLSVP